MLSMKKLLGRENLSAQKSRLKQTRIYQKLFESSLNGRKLEGGNDLDHNQVYNLIGERICGVSLSDIDPTILASVKRAILDAVVSILLGVGTEEGRAVVKFSDKYSVVDGRCAIPNSNKLYSCSQAAYAMAALSQIHDVNDGHATAGDSGGSYHPGRVIVPVSLALAQEVKMTGAEFLLMVVIGYDTALNVRNGPLGGASDSYGAAAAACVAFGLSKKESAFALKLAGFSASQSGGQDFEVNNLTCAQQAKGAVESAELVRCAYPISAGFNPLKGGFNYTPTEQVGSKINELYFKPYPSCRYTHPIIDAALKLRVELLSVLDQIEKIEIILPKGGASGTAHLIGCDEYYKSYQFSASYCAAAALVDGEVGLKQFTNERTSDPLIQKLQGKSTFSYFEYGPPKEGKSKDNIFGMLKVELAGGKKFSYYVGEPLGSIGNPLANKDIAKKLERWAGLSLVDSMCLVDKVMELEESDTLDGFLLYIQELGIELAQV